MNMTEVGEHDLKIDNDRHKIFNMTEKKKFGQIHPYFSQVQRLMFIGEKFWSCSNINVRRCEFFSFKF